MDLKKCTVLHVEDDIQALETFSFLLKDEVKVLYQADNGQVGLEMCEKYKPDIIISDLIMPIMDGIRMSQIIKDRDKDQFILFLTALDDLKTLKKALEIGIDAFESKPVDFDRLLAKLEHFASMIIAQKNIDKMQAELKRKNDIIDKHLLVTSLDNSKKITQVSEAMLRLSEYSKNDLIDKKFDIFFYDNEEINSFYRLWDSLEQNQNIKGELECIKKNGEKYWVEVLIEPVFDGDGQKCGYVAIKYNITDKKKIEFLSITDTLTKLYNRRQFNNTFNNELKKASSNNFTFGLIILDIDFFKLYNDYYGHPKGDEVLQKIGYTLSTITDKRDQFAFRIGGEEFAIILSKITKIELKEICEHILNQIIKLKIEHTKSKISNYVTASIGAIFVDDFNDADCDSIYAEADKLLYQSKKSGKNKYTLKTYKEDINTKPCQVDPVTLLPLRDSLVELIKQSSGKIMIMIINIENFAQINTLFGSKIADMVLVDRAKKYRNMINFKTSLLVRLNVNEFAIILHRVTKEELNDFLLFAKYYVLEDTACSIADNQDIVINQVIGVAIVDKENIIKKADLALKEANKRNINLYVYRDNDSLDLKTDYAIIENQSRYRKALEQNRLIPYFQPIVDAKSGEIYKYEALARLVDENGKVLSPYFFLDAAKKDRSSEFLTRQLLQKIFKVYMLNPEVRLSVNLTYQNICSKSLVDYIVFRLNENGGNRLTFEIIESEEIEDYKKIKEFIDRVKPYGCQIAIDDFGSGYSNLSHLMNLNPDFLKLDGTLIQNIGKDLKSEQIVKLLRQYAKRTGCKVIGEFVSDETIANKALELGIDLLQGYFFGKPEPPEFYSLKCN